MEGLIKGLANVALDFINDNSNNNNNNNNNDNEDERSRSTWAQVVSSGEEHNDGSGDRRNRNRKEAREDEQSTEEWENSRPPSRRPGKEVREDERRTEEWETAGRRPPTRRPHKEEEEEQNEGWENVSKKHSKQPAKVWKNNAHGYKKPLSEQEYAEDVCYGSVIEPSKRELNDVSLACNKLWELDSNRLVPGKDYEIDCGEGKKVYQKEDMAQGSLFKWLEEDVLRRPTYSRFCSLLDNYNPNEGCREVVTAQEKQEQAAFIEEISRTAPVKYLHKYLTCKGIVSENYQEFKRMLIELWFDLYGRGGTSGSSSAFEHVFVGEIKQQAELEVCGFHNWLQFYLEESKGRVDYQGYIFPRRRGQIPDSETQLLTIQFEWNGILKGVSSTLVGVSPEFEVALYTLCFLVGNEDNHVELGPYPVNIKCYRFGRDKIGSVFPIAES
ncbi:hypothetical protein Sjap_020052 [Stephania japonica]|uniref:EndoU domain-containing protein n=1 Tax=Stephania japonica TaxID=461633 RepID=A0AAP0F596_9MAGN